MQVPLDLVRVRVRARARARLGLGLGLGSANQRATAIWTAQVAVLLVGLAFVVDLNEVRQAGAADALVAEATGTRLGHLVHADETLH